MERIKPKKISVWKEVTLISTFVLSHILSACAPINNNNSTPTVTVDPTPTHTLVQKITDTPEPLPLIVTPSPIPSFTPTSDYCAITNLNTVIDSIISEANPLYTSSTGAKPDLTNTLWLYGNEAYIGLDSRLVDPATRCNIDFYLEKLDNLGGPTGKLYLVELKDGQLELDQSSDSENYEGNTHDSIAWTGGGNYKLVARINGAITVTSIDGTELKISYVPTSIPPIATTGSGGGGNGGTDPTITPTDPVCPSDQYYNGEECVCNSNDQPPDEFGCPVQVG